MIACSKNFLEKVSCPSFVEQIDDKIYVSAYTEYMLSELKSFFKEDSDLKNGHQEENP